MTFTFPLLKSRVIRNTSVNPHHYRFVCKFKDDEIQFLHQPRDETIEYTTVQPWTGADYLIGLIDFVPRHHYDITAITVQYSTICQIARLGHAWSNLE